MKKLLLMATVMCMSLFSMAQADSATAPKQKEHKEHKKGMQVANAAAWACPKCFAITKEGGQCAMDQTDKVQLGTYYCNHCMKATGAKPGKCATCTAPAVQMTRKLCAKQQQHTQKKAA
jgi:Ni/Co efflux regulator RcnB